MRQPRRRVRAPASQFARPRPTPAEFEPALLRDVELGRPLPPISAIRAGTGQRYRRARALVRLHGQPLGAVELPLSERSLWTTRYAPEIWQALAPEINEHLRRDGLPPVSGLDPTGIGGPAVPQCRERLQETLSAAPFVSVVVPTHDRPERIGACLASLLALNYPRYEIIVVDNAPSTSATAEVVRRGYGHLPHIRYVREDWPGSSAARNRGLSEARAEIVAFADDDVLVDRDWLGQLVASFGVADDVACVTGRILPQEWETPAQAWIGQNGDPSWKGNTRQMFDRGAHRRGNPLYPYSVIIFGASANMAFKATALREIGGFDLALGVTTPALAGEDGLAFLEVILRGHKLVHAPAAIVRHADYREYAQLRRQFFGYGAGQTACITQALLSHPERLREFLPKLARSLFAFTGRTRRPRAACAGESVVSDLRAMSADLARIERRGLLYGPLACLRSRRYVRRLRAQFQRSPRREPGLPRLGSEGRAAFGQPAPGPRRGG